MSLEPGMPALGGSALLTTACFAAFHLFAAGPMVGERTIGIKDGWTAQCQRAVVTTAQRKKPVLQSVPNVPDCNQIADGVGKMLGQYGGGNRAYCGLVDSLIDLSPARQIKQQNRRAMEAYKNSIARAAQNAGSACSCSVQVVLSQDRISWAIHSASFRLFEPAEVRNRQAKLMEALSSPLCSGRAS